ncbi:hypothetical protein A2U01_0100828, partial [Trifolium medium]|nr:hypothetical protein [Trifolium medium]
LQASSAAPHAHAPPAAPHAQGPRPDAAPPNDVESLHVRARNA